MSFRVLSTSGGGVNSLLCHSYLLQVLAGGGKVTIERQSWAASLGLRMSEKDGVGRGREEGWRLPITEHSREAWSLEDILREEREKGGQE